MKTMTWTCAMAGLALVVSSCHGTNPVREKPADATGATKAGILAVVNGNNQFALDVYSALSKQETGNLFLSPYSLSEAMAMVYEGARGQTAKEIENVFHFPTDEVERRAAFAAVHNLVSGPNAKYELDVANALWAQQGYGFLNTYLNTLSKYYGAQAANVDFKNATEEARKTINTWVEEKTRGNIKDLFSPGVLDGATRLVLTNAVYFKGKWVTQFDKSQTRDEPFHASPDQSVTVPMMRLTGEGVEFKYTENENVQVLEMPYEGNALSMLLLLPPEGKLSDFENTLTLDELNAWRNQLAKQRVDVFLPKFTFSTKYLMNGTLEKMGMPTAFSTTADFSGMDGTHNLAIQCVIHQAFVDVNEEGTEAAAATGVGVGLTAVRSPIPVFRADRPFLFIIQDTENGDILFLGRVVNPELE